MGKKPNEFNELLAKLQAYNSTAIAYQAHDILWLRKKISVSVHRACVVVCHLGLVCDVRLELSQLSEFRAVCVSFNQNVKSQSEFFRL
jgi:hypothetical protein